MARALFPIGPPGLRTRRALAALLALCAVALPATARGDTVDRFWILWERAAPCPAATQPCAAEAGFLARAFSPETPAQVMGWIAAPEAPRPAVPGGLPGHPEGARICLTAARPDAAAPRDHEAQELSDPILALRGLTAVAFDLTALPAPPGETEDFGRRLHADAVARFEAAGLRVLRPGDVGRIAGQPKFSVFFSFTGADSTCDYSYSVFASLSQTAVLTRSPDVKLSVGTWSASFRPPVGSEARAGGEYALILSAIDAFLAAVATAGAVE